IHMRNITRQLTQKNSNSYSLIFYFIIPFLFIVSEVRAQEQGVKNGKSTRVPKGESYVSFTDNGAWCWFSDPRAIYFKGRHSRTYGGWVDSSGSIIVGVYDHD